MIQIDGSCGSCKAAHPGRFLTYFLPGYADVAQLAEQLLCKHQVRGSNPSGGSNSERRMNMKQILLIALAGVQLVMLLGLVAVLPALYRREASRQEEKA